MAKLHIREYEHSNFLPQEFEGETMLHRLPQPPLIELNSNPFEKPIKVDLQAYLEFCFWMSEELLDLEARYSSRAHRRPEHNKVKH